MGDSIKFPLPIRVKDFVGDLGHTHSIGEVIAINGNYLKILLHGSKDKTVERRKHNVRVLSRVADNGIRYY